MENILFIYNIVLTVLLTVALVGFYLIYMSKKKKGFLFAALLFLLLIIDNSIIYMAEFFVEFGQLYETSDILYAGIQVIYIGIIIAIRLVVSDFFQDKCSSFEKRGGIALLFILTAVTVFAPVEVSDSINNFAYFALLFYVVFRGYKNFNMKKDDENEKDIKKVKVCLSVIMILIVIGFVDNGLFILDFYFDPEHISSTFSYRTLSFDIIKFIICIMGIKKLYNSFQEIFRAEKQEVKKIVIRDKSQKIEEFCLEHSLTARQREIIELIVEGLTNKEIGEKLHITEGTVKVHANRVFKKTDISNRRELVKAVLMD